MKNKFNSRKNSLFSIIILLISCFHVNAQKNSIQWFAHRGYLGLHPENTIKGMKKALHYKSTVLEMDLVITKDKQVVVSHDVMLNHKITLDSNGLELPVDQKIAIYKRTYREIKTYDVGTKLNSAFPQQIRYKAHIPLFSELIDSVESYVKENGLQKPTYFIETKSKFDADSNYQPSPEEFIDLIMTVVLDKGIQDRVIVQSFDPRTLQVLHRKYPEIPLAFLTRRGTNMKANLEWLGFIPTYYSAKPELINKEFMKKCRKIGMLPIVGVFTDYKEFLHLKKLGVRGFIADYPLEYLKDK